MSDPSFRADERDQQAAMWEAMDDLSVQMWGPCKTCDDLDYCEGLGFPDRRGDCVKASKVELGEIKRLYPVLTDEQAQELADAVNRYGPADHADRDSDDIDIDDSGVWENSVQDAGGPC